MSAWWHVALVVALLLTTQVTVAGETKFSLELTAADTLTSYSDDAAWGWWNQDKYSSWLAESEDETQLVEGRLLFVGDTYTVFFAAERYPTLQASGLHAGTAQQHGLTTKLEVYDLVIAQWFRGSGRTGIFPWAGLTRMRIREIRTTYNVQDLSPVESEDLAKSYLWGVAAGADGELWINNRFGISGRVLLRWAKGDRKGTQHVEAEEGEDDFIPVDFSDSTKRAMYGADLGLRMVAYRGIELEGGWRYRDWQHDSGLASFSGPYLRLRVHF
jgi:hypothetical protein